MAKATEEKKNGKAVPDASAPKANAVPVADTRHPLQDKCDEFNKAHKVGKDITVKLGTGEEFTGKMKHEAQIQNDVIRIWVHGLPTEKLTIEDVVE